MTERAEATVRVKLASPFVFQGLSPSSFGIDVSLLRERDGAGKVVLPGTLLRGNLRAALEAIAARCPGVITLQEIDCWLGEESPKDSDNQPARSMVDFDDLIAVTEEPEVGESYYRIEIEEGRASVRHGSMQIIELPWPIGAEVAFSGRIVFFLAPSERERLCRALQVAFDGALPALGAFKSVGFGRVINAAVDPPETARPLALAPLSGQDAGDDLEVFLELDRPFLVDSERVADNVFRGSMVIPGAALKGAIARRAELSGEKNTEFDDALAKIIVGHAFPVGLQSALDDTCPPHQPSPLPLSLVSAPPVDGSEEPHRLADVLVAEGPCTFSGVAPLFQTWKKRTRPYPDPWALCGWPERLPEHITRVRTAIEPETWAASEQKLFAHSAVCADDHFWLMRMSRNGADPAVFSRVLGTLRDGIDGIGRTRARATRKHMQQARPLEVKPLDNGSPEPQFALSLQTEALLNDPSALRRGTSLRDDYAVYWLNVSGGRLRLVRFFAEQRLAGGYIATRRRLDHNLYDPFLITKPGSVFLLEGDGCDIIARWCAYGLPLSPTLGQRANWRNCPYMPENGYGAVRVNVIDHVGLAEGAEVV